MLECKIVQELGFNGWGINPSMDGSRFALAANPDGRIVQIRKYGTAPPDAAARWWIVFHAANKWNCGFVLINKQYNRMLRNSGLNRSPALVDVPSDGAIQSECLWQFYRYSSGLQSIHPLLDTGVHLRYGPGTSVDISNESTDSYFLPTEGDISYTVMGCGMGGKWMVAII